MLFIFLVWMLQLKEKRNAHENMEKQLTKVDTLAQMKIFFFSLLTHKAQIVKLSTQMRLIDYCITWVKVGITYKLSYIIKSLGKKKGLLLYASNKTQYEAKGR